MLQWGRDHAIAEIRDAIRRAYALIGLQWGRDHAIAEMIGFGVDHGVQLDASMGPRSRDRGNCFQRFTL